MKFYNRYRAELYALIAAILNGSIGVLTQFGMSSGASHQQIAFYKCFVAFSILLTYGCMFKNTRREIVELSAKWRDFAILSFFGVFCLYFFETWAFSNASIPLVSFLTYAAGGVTLILSAYVLKEKLTRVKVLSFGFVVFGVCLIFNYEFVVTGSYFGMFLALIGGLGYALFIFLSKFLKVGCGFSQLVWLFGFGSLYLFVPAVFSGPIEINYNAMVPIFFLVVFPTIGGFYFTTKAIEGSEAGKVQIIETSDPLFATLFGFLIFGQILTIGSLWGASCIVFGLLLVVLSKKNEVVI